jgi:hypothetical protein
MAVGFDSEEIHLYRLRERLRAMSDEGVNLKLIPYI